MDKLSPNFTAAEFACQCGCGFASPDSRLVAGLQALRDLMGVPVVILSGCRCAAHNKAVGGAEHSTHLQGKAADIRVEGCSPRALYDEAKKVPHFKGFGVDDERGFIHVDVRDIPARWCYHNGREAIWRER